jgi:hypothetical protein
MVFIHIYIFCVTTFNAAGRGDSGMSQCDRYRLSFFSQSHSIMKKPPTHPSSAVQIATLIRGVVVSSKFAPRDTRVEVCYFSFCTSPPPRRFGFVSNTEHAFFAFSLPSPISHFFNIFTPIFNLLLLLAQKNIFQCPRRHTSTNITYKKLPFKSW